MELKNAPGLQTFESIKQMDEHVRSFLSKRKAALSEATMKVLTFIWRHSVKYPGVSFAKNETIAKKTGCSNRTVIRAVNRLIKEKLLERVPTIRPNGRQGANILLILPQENIFLLEDVTPVVTPIDTLDKSANPSYDNLQQGKSTPETKNKQSKNDNSKTDTIDHSFLPSFIPRLFIEQAQPFLSPAETYTAWKTVTNAFRQFHMNHPLEDYLQPIIEVFKQTIFAEKNGMIKTDIFRYYYGGLLKRLEEIGRKEVMDDPDTLYYDWLNA